MGGFKLNCISHKQFIIIKNSGILKYYYYIISVKTIKTGNFFQIQVFRTLAGGEGQLTHNFRPVQPLYDRIIYMNSLSNSLKIDTVFLIVCLFILCTYSNVTK